MFHQLMLGFTNCFLVKAEKLNFVRVCTINILYKSIRNHWKLEVRFSSVFIIQIKIIKGVFIITKLLRKYLFLLYRYIILIFIILRLWSTIKSIGEIAKNNYPGHNTEYLHASIWLTVLLKTFRSDWLI